MKKYEKLHHNPTWNLDAPIRAFVPNDVEQGAFLFANYTQSGNSLHLRVCDIYPVPSTAWLVQSTHYLEMRDDERAKIMKMARDRDAALVECHSHPHSGSQVQFSPSDIKGLDEFSQYAHWKLDGKPYAALVFGEISVAGKLWHGDFSTGYAVEHIAIESGGAVPTPTKRRGWLRFLFRE